MGDQQALHDDRAEVQVVVPAGPAYVRLLRLTAADVAARAGFDLDDLDDLRIAVGELCFALTGRDGVSGRLEVTFVVTHGEVEVRGVARYASASDGADRVPPPLEISEQILGAVLDEVDLDRDSGEPSFRAVKRSSLA